MPSRPTKSEIRDWLRRAREDLVGLNAALMTENVSQIEHFLVDGISALDEVANLVEERYDIEIECPDDDDDDDDDIEEIEGDEEE